MALRCVLMATVAVFVCMAGVEHRYSTTSVNTAAEYGSVLRLEGERVALHLVRL